MAAGSQINTPSASQMVTTSQNNLDDQGRSLLVLLQKRCKRLGNIIIGYGPGVEYDGSIASLSGGNYSLTAVGNLGSTYVDPNGTTANDIHGATGPVNWEGLYGQGGSQHGYIQDHASQLENLDLVFLYNATKSIDPYNTPQKFANWPSALVMQPGFEPYLPAPFNNPETYPGLVYPRDRAQYAIDDILEFIRDITGMDDTALSGGYTDPTGDTEMDDPGGDQAAEPETHPEDTPKGDESAAGGDDSDWTQGLGGSNPDETNSGTNPASNQSEDGGLDDGEGSSQDTGGDEGFEEDPGAPPEGAGEDDATGGAGAAQGGTGTGTAPPPPAPVPPWTGGGSGTGTGTGTGSSGSDSSFGLSEEDFQAFLDAGLVVGHCEDPPSPPLAAPGCPPCIPNPEAVVPNWKQLQFGEVYKNERTCHYCVSVNTGVEDASVLNDPATREAFCAEQIACGVEYILQNFGKWPLDESSLGTVIGVALVKEYDVPLRRYATIRVLVCLPVYIVEAITMNASPEDATPNPVFAYPNACVLNAQSIRPMIDVVRDGFRYYGKKYALWAYETNNTIPGFDPMQERKNLNKFIPALARLMRRNGFKLNGDFAAEQVELRFNQNYEVVYAQANEPTCEPVELKWEKNGDILGGFKELSPINNPRTMAYIASLPDMYEALGARTPNAWDEFFVKFTYPSINVDNVVDPLGAPVLADGPLQKAAQAIVEELVSLPDSITARFYEDVCRDLAGQSAYNRRVRTDGQTGLLDIRATFADFAEEVKGERAYSNARNVIVGDQVIGNMKELIDNIPRGGDSLNELFDNILNPLSKCGWLELIDQSARCLSLGIPLSDMLRTQVKVVLKSLDITHLEKVFVGLPPEKQLEIRNVINEQFGNMPFPWEQGYRPGGSSYSYSIELDEDGNPVPEDHIGADGGLVYAADDERTIQERTAQHRREAIARRGSVGTGGTIGAALDASYDAIVEAYIDTILSSVDAEYLLGELSTYPGAEILKKVVEKETGCEAPPLFNPPLNDFLKTLEFDFCQGKRAFILLPKLEKFQIPDFYRLFMQALLEVILEAAFRIAMTVLEQVVGFLLDGYCALIGMLGDMAAGLLSNQPTNNFADSIRSSLSNTGLDALGFPIPLSDDDTLNQAAADLFGSFSTSCTDPGALPTGPEAAEFLREVGLIMTQGEFVDLLEGVAAREVYTAIYQLVVARHPKFLCIFPDTAAIERFFQILGSMIDPGFLNRGTPGAPVYSGVCSDETNSTQINALRSNLLAKKNLNPDLVNEILDSLSCNAISDLEDLISLMQNGLPSPNIMEDGCNAGLVPRDPSADILPQGPMGMLRNPGGIFDGTFQILESAYYDDLMGRNGFLNMILSDRDGRNLRSHNLYIAFKSIFGIFGGKPASHELLLPKTVAQYLLSALQSPTAPMYTGDDQDDGYNTFIITPFQPPTSEMGGNGNNSNLQLGYNNYYPKSHADWYGSKISLWIADYSSLILNNAYTVKIKEKFGFGLSSDPTYIGEASGRIDDTMIVTADPGLPSGVQELIESLNLDIEATLESGFPTAMSSEICPQSVTFGKYIENILRSQVQSAALEDGNSATNQALEFIAEACATDVFDYISATLFNFLAGEIATSNDSFKYGEGGPDFEKNAPITYAPTKIDLDENHVHPVTGEPQPLDPLAFGGNAMFPAFYIQPPQNRPGWCGIADRMIPEVDACEPKRTNLVGFQQLTEPMTEFYSSISDDPRLKQDSRCAIEAPCNKILGRSAAAMIEGNIKATIRTYVAEAYLKGMPCFSKFKPDTQELYGDPLPAYIAETLKSGFFLYSKKGFGRRKSDEYYYQFLEQCVQNFGRKVDAELITPTSEEQAAMDYINERQIAWMDYTGEKLKRTLSPGYLGAQIMNATRGGTYGEGDVLKASEARKLKEREWDLFMRDVEPYAEVISKRYISEEIRYISEEFSKRMAPKYKTLYEMFLGNENFGFFGNLDFNADSIPESTPADLENPFAVPSTSGPAADVSVYNPGTDLFLQHMAYNNQSTYGAPDPLNRPNPASLNCAPPIMGVPDFVGGLDRYWPFVLESYIYIADYEDSDFKDAFGTVIPELQGAYNVWNSTVKPSARPGHLGGTGTASESYQTVVKASEWKAWLEVQTNLDGFNRGDLWKNWKYGLRIIFVPPTYDIGETMGFQTSTGDIMPKGSQIKQKIADDIQPYFKSGRQQRYKAFDVIGEDGANSDISKNPMSIPIVKKTAAMPMNVSATSDGWYTSYENEGGFPALVQSLVCSDEYKMIFRYCFNVPRILSVLGIYIMKSFLPSIGAAGDEQIESPVLDTVAFLNLFIDDPERPSEGLSDDGWYEPDGFASLFSSGEYFGGGRKLFPGSGAFRNFEWENTFARTKKLLQQAFEDLYNSEDNYYISDSETLSAREQAKEARGALNITWPKFSVRLKQKQVDRPYDMNGDLCFDPDDDYQD